MKKYLFLFVSMLLVFAAAPVAAQAVLDPQAPFAPGTTLEALVNWQTGLAATLMSLLAYLQPYVAPGFLPKAKVVVRYLTLAITVVLILLSLGVANGWQLALGLFFSAGSYTFFLEPLGLKTAKPKRA